MNQHGDAPESQDGWWRSFKDALRGKELDYTSGPLNRAIVMLSIPMILEMVMESVFAVVDVWFVSRLGKEAVAIVGLTETVFTLIMAIAIGLAMATTAMVARRIGEKRREDARNAARQAIYLGILISLPISLVGITMSREILELMGATPEVVEQGHYNVMIMFAGNATLLLLFLINAIFRGAGNASIAMWVLWLGNIINIILDPCLIFGWGPFPELGVTGAAVATVIGRGVAVLVQLYVLFSGKSVIQLRFRRLAVDFIVMWRLFKVAVTGMVQFLISTSSWIALTRITAEFGNEALAGYTIAIRIIIFSILPSWGLSNATATLVGQNLGAGKPDRAEKSVWLTGLYNMVFLIFLSIAFITIPEFLIELFNTQEGVVFHGSRCLRIIAFGYLFYAYGMVLVQAFNGAGDTATPTRINFLCHWIVQIPLAWFLAIKMEMGPTGVFTAIPISEALMTLIAALIFRRGSWKNQKI